MVSKKDGQILNKILSGDQKTIFYFYKKHYPSLVKFISKELDHHLAEEVAQDAFMAFFEGLRSFQGKSSLKTYLYSIARYKKIDQIRKKKVKKILFSALPSYFVESIAYILFDDHLEKKVITEKIEKAVSKLPNDYKRILRLRYWQGHKVKNIAVRLKMSFKATESLLFRARKAFIRQYQIYDEK